VQVVALEVLLEATAEDPSEATADLRAKVADDTEGAHIELVEGEAHAAAIMRAAPETVESDAALAMTQQVYCLTSVLVETTSRRLRSHTLAKVRGISKWSQ